VKIFPNPATAAQTITVLLDEEIAGNVQIDIISATGECIYHDTFYKVSSEYRHSLNLQNTERGIYLINVTNGSNFGTQKLIIQ